MVEFRGIMAYQRIQELQDALTFFVPQLTYKSPLQYEVAIDDTSSTVPIAIYTKFPSEEIAKKVAHRCATVRTIAEIWGEGVTPEEVNVQAIANYNTLIQPHFSSSESAKLRIETSGASENSTEPMSWRVTFQRYGRGGRSGLDYDGKRALLSTFKDLLESFEGPVDLKNPRHSLVFLEDWHDFHRMETLLNSSSMSSASDALQQTFFQQKQVSLNKDLANNEMPNSLVKDILQNTRRRCFFGRIIAEGPLINTKLDLRTRPFIGSTAMKPINAHIACVAAKIAPGDVVLDPFCGTASVLLSAAYLGAYVVGSDIADDFAHKDSKATNGVLELDKVAGSISLQSKNLRYRRRDGSIQDHLSPHDNFAHYGFPHLVRDLFRTDAHTWLADHMSPVLPNSEDVYDQRISEKYGVSSSSFYFDAIVSDPPFCRREKFFNSMGSEGLSDDSQQNDATDSSQLSVSFANPIMTNVNGDPYEAVRLLMLLAIQRLLPKQGKRLVFWLPTDSDITKDQVTRYLQTCISQVETKVGSKAVEESPNPAQNELVIVNVCPEYLSDALTRWLCILERQ